MFQKINGGTKIIEQHIPLWLPPEGYVFDSLQNTWVKVDIDNRLETKHNQYFRRKGLPIWWDKKHAIELKKQESDPLYVDEDCEKFRREQWFKRLFGHWFLNDGKATYLTGENWMYLEWWDMGKRYPSYRETDRRYYYLMEWVKECPYCYGAINMQERQTGKSAKSGLFMFNRISLIKNSDGAIQSKSLEEARDTVYMKNIVRPFLSLPDYFRPTYDTSNKLGRGIFFKPTLQRGSSQVDSQKQKAIYSHIGYQDSGVYACDGLTLDAYIADEIFKSKDIDIKARHEVILPLLAPNGDIEGKALYTSTVENIDGRPDVLENSIQFWNDSDQSKVDIEGGKMTKTGLIQIFFNACEIRNCNIYGRADVKQNEIYFAEQRAMRQNDMNEMLNYIRKHPFNPEEAFMTSRTTSTFTGVADIIKKALMNLHFTPPLFLKRGNLVWVETDREVRWVDDENGRCVSVYQFEDDADMLNKSYRNGMLMPCNDYLLDFGVDPFDHYKDKKYKQYSNGAGLIKMRPTVTNEGKYYDGAFIFMYLHRTDTPDEFFEDMIKVCFYFGVSMLYEDQADGIRSYFERRGYVRFLRRMKNATKPGVSASKKAKEQMVLLYTRHFLECKDKLFIAKLLQQADEFDIENTLKFDAFMAGGYALIGEEDARPKRPIDEAAKKRVKSVLENSSLLRRHPFRN